MKINYNLERSVIAFFSYVIIDFIFHGLIISNFFWHELEDIARTGSEIKYLPLLAGMAYVAIIFALFMQFIDGGPLNHFVYGAILGSMFIIPYHLVNFAFFYDYSISLVIVDSAVSTLEFAIVGLLLYKYTEFRFLNPNNSDNSE